MVAKFVDLNNLSWWKWRNDSRSERNLCNCVKKPEKNSGLQRGLNPWPRDYRCDALPTELWSHWRWEQVNCGFICSRERNECGIFFSGFFTQLHKLRSLRRSFLHFHFISAVHIWFISYIINNLSWQRRPFTCWTMEENYGLLFCFWKVLLVIFSLFLSYWKDHGLLRSWNFATMATWRNDFSSLLTTPHTNVIFSWKYCSLPFEWWL